MYIKSFKYIKTLVKKVQNYQLMGVKTYVVYINVYSNVIVNLTLKHNVICFVLLFLLLFYVILFSF